MSLGFVPGFSEASRGYEILSVRSVRNTHMMDFAYC